MDKLVAMQKQAGGSEPSLLTRLTPLESKAANLFKLEYVLRSSQYQSVVQQGSQSSMEVAGDTRKEGFCAQNGNGGECSFGLADYTLSKAPRNIKFSFDENCALVHEAVGVWDSIIGKNAATTSQARKNFLWSRIVDSVNAAGSQPRSAENCKKRLRDIKRRVKAKMADQRKYSHHNGGAGPCLELQYLSYEEELMHVIGPDTVRPIEGHVDTDREPRKYEPEEENCYEDDFWNHSSFDLAEEEEDDDREMVIKMEPIDYSKEALTPSPQSFPGPSLPPQPCSASQLHIPSTKPVVTTRPSVIPTKPIPAATKSVPVVTKPLPLSTKPSLVTTKPQMIPNHPYSSLTTPINYPTSSNPGTINKVVGTLHTAQRHYHRSQRHQMHVLHMDLLHLGVGVQQLTRNVKVNNHIRATERAREFRLKQKALEDQQQYRMEKLRLLQQHHEAKLRIIQEHYAKKEKLMHENNLLLQGILQRFSSPAGTCLIASCPTDQHSTSHIKASSMHSDPSPPTPSSEKQTSKGVRTRGGKGREGT